MNHFEVWILRNIQNIQRISAENNHRISVSMGLQRTRCLSFKSEKTGDNVGELLVGRHRDIAIVIFRMEIDIDFRTALSGNESLSGKGVVFAPLCPERNEAVAAKALKQQAGSHRRSLCYSSSFAGFFETRLRRFFGRDLSGVTRYCFF